MKWLRRTRFRFLQKWHNWFAWYPVPVRVFVKGEGSKITMVWLGMIQRKGSYYYDGYACKLMWNWSYKLY